MQFIKSVFCLMEQNLKQYKLQNFYQMDQSSPVGEEENNKNSKKILQNQDLQNPKPDREAEKTDRKQEAKPSDPKITERVGKKLTQLAENEGEKKQSNVNSSNSRVASTINKSLSREPSLRLPNIGDSSKNFGDKIYDKQSSATLQKSILVYSMPKAPRFMSGPKYSGQLSYYVDTCFKPNSPKGVGFGFGNKRQFPEWMEKNMKENPPPGAYFDQAKHLTVRPKGPTFGISYKFYQKVTIPLEKSPQRVAKSSQRLKPIFRGQ